MLNMDGHFNIVTSGSDSTSLVRYKKDEGNESCLIGIVLKRQ